MGTINYNFEPEDAVYVISTCSENPFVTSGVVVRVRATVIATGTTVSYDVKVEDDLGTTAFAADDVFVDKASALVEYETRVV